MLSRVAKGMEFCRTCSQTSLQFQGNSNDYNSDNKFGLHAGIVARRQSWEWS
ncbi:hypothetical protein VFPBJ_03729 [Purpureocillium lilacinum]|uniref:Uncharacterized protein n=1 Tax=Purpureocillium lilacinum TaxID=33203 RepID=A0A179H5U7_PURLI|nr:hypothetical protein VFPBJ_03729 [Purpureocillium lilacinum]